ncbi:uncharacterized protein LOC126366459 [Pectinophora gossypiella]|uniref:uncharacterized protein LOC126366459 n=1 Tax=Pectinophora gossypiella TaxID=13191 RepID=UPI00214E5060|nr:uncharacterized protein LOC126366459 [Pectinophora gossypiella]
MLTINPKEVIDMKTVEAFDTLYYAVEAAADQLMPKPRERVDDRALGESTANSAAKFKPIAQVRLPKIELPKYDGNIEHWQTFYDTFLSLVHENENISTAAACPVTSMPGQQASASGMEPAAVTMNTTSSGAHVGHSRALVLLGTCTVRARGPAGTFNVRALIDSGAQDCFMTSACAQRLGLPLRRCHVAVAGLGQNTVHQIKGIASCSIQPCDSHEPSFDVSPIVMNTITNKMPAVEVPSTVRDSFKHLTLADENFDKPNDIDLLLGAELFHNVYDGQRLNLGPGLPVALHSVFGWVLTGKLDPECRPPPTTSSLFASTLALDNVVKRFWEVEEPPSVDISNPEDDKCEQLYTNLVKRNPDGRYVVPMLVKEPCEKLGDSYNISLSRFTNLERRLHRHDQLKEDYVRFMREYSELGHMQPVDPPNDSDRNIIPHHCVLRPDSSTTKLRVVFDGSARTTNGKALNDIVHTGPKLQNDIVDIITKFRLHEVVFTADISKMYRNIDLRPEDRKYQHIFWRDSTSEPVREYELTTVTYGVSSSPYLAIRTLHQLADDHCAQWPRAAEIIKHDTFMDDITVGAPSVEEAIELKNELVKLLDCAKFELRKWSSNSPEFLSQLPSEHCQIPKPFCDNSNQHTLKILGIQWDPTQDNFTYSASQLDSKCTKRSILSNVARIYDPLGWLTPVVLIAKLLIQDLWRRQLDWDESVPADVSQQWQNFVSELQNLTEVRIPRRVALSNTAKYELVGFCDGSTKAYGCCVYQRSIGDGDITSHLLIAKSRVAPLKPLTVNRLELCGAALLARVLKHMYSLLHSQINIVRVTAFTDSSTVLAWLNTPPYKLKTFVSHRVAKIIDEVSVENWLHVSTHDNPADHCSRGLPCSQIITSPTWWSGPKWLLAESTSWPIQRELVSPDNIPELKSTAHVALPTSEKDDAVSQLIHKCSSLSRVQRVLAWCLRFVANSKRSSEARITSPLTVEELNTSLSTLARHEQAASFSEEIDSVKSNIPSSGAAAWGRSAGRRDATQRWGRQQSDSGRADKPPRATVPMRMSRGYALLTVSGAALLVPH